MADASWDGFVSPNWNEPAGSIGSNWNGGSGNAPDGTASFPDNSFNRYNVLFSQPDTKIQQIVFGSAKPYTFTLSIGQELEITGSGISTGAAAVPTFNLASPSGPSGATLVFENAATAANVIFNIPAGSIYGSLLFKNTSTAFKSTINQSDGHVAFYDGSTAGAATIISNSQDTIASSIEFYKSSSAGSANISLQGATMRFVDQSSAAQAFISISGAGTLAFFNNNSSLQNASVTNGGLLFFLDNSTGGDGSITNSGSVSFAYSPGGNVHASGNFSIGEITGSGLISFGSSNVQLHVTGISPASGPSHQSAEWAGTAFTDNIGGVISGNGGITMDAPGTLTLAAANTFTGDTVITAGTIELAATGSIAGNFVFQNTALSASAGETLKLDAPNQIGGMINGFAKGDTIDISFHAFAAGDHFVWTPNVANTGGTLALQNASGAVITTLNLSGVHSQSEFAIASDGTGGTVFTDTVGSVFPFTTNLDAAEALFVGYFGRAGDPGGTAYWLNQLATGAISAAGAAASFSVQAEAQAQYPFLANQSLGPTETVTSSNGWSLSVPTNVYNFINSVYQDLFNRSVLADGSSSGLSYWSNQLSQNLGNPQAVGGFVINVSSGAQGNDQAALVNKVAVAEYMLEQFNLAGIPSFGSQATALAHAAIASVTSNASTVASAEASISAFLSAHPAGASLIGVSQAVQDTLT